MSRIRLIALDVDGTLYDRPNGISEENLAALHAAQEQGVVVAIATGRTPANMLMRSREMGLYCPIVGSNGTHIVDENNKLLYEYTMDTKAAQEAQYRLSQLDTEYKVEDFGPYDNAKFGLAYTSVGMDVSQNDFFENITK